jgi:hypothetical protein
MPLSAKAQAERRARLKRLAEPKKIRRARCANCDKPFPKTKPNRKFCKKECKREYEQNGGTAFGPLKTRLEKLVRQITGALEVRHTFLEKRVTKIDTAGLEENLRIEYLEEVVKLHDAQIARLQGSAPAQSPSQPSPSSRANTGHWHDPAGRG